ESLPHAAVGEDDLEAEHLLARIAVGQHGDAAGVGGEVAADLAAPLRGQAEGEQPIGLVGSRLRLGEGEARLHRQGLAGSIPPPDALEAADVEQNLAVHWDLPTDQPGVARLRYDRKAMLMRQR